jgi:hypothetical protein
MGGVGAGRRAGGDRIGERRARAGEDRDREDERERGGAAKRCGAAKRGHGANVTPGAVR